MADIVDLQGDDDGFRKMAVPEFVRRVRRGITRDNKRYSWLIGAGCSASSGVPTAAECARLWTKELKYLDTGSEHDVERWAAEQFAGFDPARPAASYGDVLRRLFHTDSDLRLELERMTTGAEPGFGYATLAQLMTHAKWGEQVSLALSMNFDDLLADALHVYSQTRPHTISQEALTAATPLTPGTPTLLKLHGDAHLPAIEEAANRPRFRESVRDRLRGLLNESGLIILGYGGREECMLDVLEGLPRGAPMGGVFWVNEERPYGAFGDWLRRTGAVWVPHSDFDELMYCMRVEFGLGHPKIDRFEQMFRKYNAQYRDLLTRQGMSIGGTPDEDGSDVEPQAIRTPRLPNGMRPHAEAEDGFGEEGVGLDGLDEQAARRETDRSRHEKLRKSLRAYTGALKKAQKNAPPRQPGVFRRPSIGIADLLDEAVIELQGDDRPPSAPPPETREPDLGRSLRPSDIEAVWGNSEGASPDAEGARLTQQREGQQGVGGLGSPARQEPRRLGEALGELAGENGLALSEGGPPALRSAAARAASDSGLKSATPPPATPPTPEGRAAELARMGRMLSAGRRLVAQGGSAALDDADLIRGLPAEPSRRLPVSRASYGEASFAAALEAAPNDARLRARFAQFLAIGVGELSRAEAEFETAQQLAPGDVAILREYARFSLNHLRDPARAQALLGQALHQDRRDAETLLSLADFLTRAFGDLNEAENCLRLAVQFAPDSPRSHLAFADFLWRRRGRLDEAESQLRRAAELTPESAEALAALAHFQAAGLRRLDAAQQTLTRAERIAPADAEVAYARALLAELRGDADEAEAHFRKAIGAAPGLIDAQIAFACFLQRRRGDLDEAERVLRVAIETAPFRAGPSTAYGRFLASARDDRVKAEATLRDAVAAEPYDAEALAALAEHLASQPEHADEVEDLFTDALALAPRSSTIHLAYGRFLAEHKGDLDAGEAQLRAAVDIDPQNAETNDALAQFLHLSRQDAEEAEVFFREALKLAPDRSDMLNRFARFLRSTKRDADEAQTFYRRALEANPRDPHSLAQSAQFLLGKGRKAEGLKVLTDAFDAAWRMDPAVRPDSLMLQLWIYRYAHDQARRDESLKAARTLIESGVRCEGWDLGPLVKAAISAGHPDPDILHDLAAVAADGGDASRILRRSD